MLGFTEVLGVLAIVLPQVSFPFKEWVYTDFLYLYISAFIAHVVAGDGLELTLRPPITLIILVTSYFYFHKLNKVFAEKKVVS